MNKILQQIKKLSFFLIVTAIVIIVLFVLAAISLQHPKPWITPLACTLLIIEMGYVLWFGIWYLFNSISEQMRQYKYNNNLGSGVTACILIAALFIAVPWLFSRLFAQSITQDIQIAFQTYLQLLIAVIPSIIGLMGVRHSIVIQDSNRRDDLRLAAKPFLSLKYKFGGFTQIESDPPHGINCFIKLSNISSNIAIPIGIGIDRDSESKLSFWYSYMPLPGDEIRESCAYIDNGQAFISNEICIRLYYKDTLNNYYYIRARLDLSKSSKYSTPIIAEDILCPPEVVTWIKKTEFSRSEDYWKSYNH